MKTLTEFASIQLNRGLTLLNELTTAGKTPEEIAASFTETLKYEGDKLKHFMNALNLVKEKTDRLKRVIVLALAEGEQAPRGASAVEGHAYVAEQFPSPQAAAGPARDEGRGARGGKKGGRGDKRGGGKGRGNEGRPPRGAGNTASITATGTAPSSGKIIPAASNKA